MNWNEEQVGSYYDTSIFEEELERLERAFPIERAITLRWIERVVPDSAVVAEIGVGGGVYSEALARRGCRLHLVDVSARLLDAVAARLRAAGLDQLIASTTRESAVSLTSLPSGLCDAVLLLGPLYHLTDPAARRQAVAEAARILKPAGVLLAAAINRLAYLRELFRESPRAVRQRVAFHAGYLRDGNLDPDHAPPIGFANMTTTAEFAALFDDAFDRVALAGVESFTAPWQSTLNDLAGEDAEAWLDLVDETGRTTEGLCQSDHFLYVGRRR
jgi:SAM-dependent methyltransferase